MSLISRASRRHRRKDAGELNITAFMNLMVVLVPFLLITAVFSRLTILELNLPSSTEVTPETLRKAGLATRKDPVKILARGDISKALTVRAHGFSGTAREKIEAAGGTCEVIEGQ